MGGSCFRGDGEGRNRLYFCAVFMTRWTVKPSLMPSWLRLSLSFKILPAKIKTSCSFLALNRFEISSLNWNKVGSNWDKGYGITTGMRNIEACEWGEGKGGVLSKIKRFTSLSLQ